MILAYRGRSGLHKLKAETQDSAGGWQGQGRKEDRQAPGSGTGRVLVLFG